MKRDTSEAIMYEAGRIADYKVQHASYDKTYSGVISEILFEPDTDIKSEKFGTYKVRYNTSEKTFKLNDGIVHEVGERVMVYVPENNPNRMFVEPVVKRSIARKIIYDHNSDTFTEIHKTITNGKTYEVQKKFKLTVINKGTDKEEVTKMTLPDGSEIEFEGWDI